MRLYPASPILTALLLTIGLTLGSNGLAESVMEPENRAVTDPQDVIDPPLSWVCLNPDTRLYQSLKAASLQQAQQHVGGDDSTPCKAIPAAMDPERVASDLNTQNHDD